MSRAARPVGRVLAVFLLAAVPAASQTGFVHWETPHVSPIALTPAGDRLLVVNTADNRLEVFDLSSGEPVALGSIRVGLDPVSVRARTNNEAWVVNHVSDSISVVDLPTGRVVRTILTGDEPTDVVFAGAPQRAFVSLSQLNQIAVYDPLAPGAAPTILPIQGEEPRMLAASADGTRVFVAIFESGNATGAIRQQDVSNPAGPYGGLNPPPNSGNAFSPPIAAGLPPPPPVAHIVRRAAPGQWLDVNGRNWSAFVTWDLHDNDVAIINTATLTVSFAKSLMTTVMAIGVRPDGNVSAVGTEALNEIRFEPNLSGRFLRCRVASFDPAAPASPQVADLNPHLTYAGSNIPWAQRQLSIGDPRAIVWHPTSGRAYVAGMGSNNVIVTDATGARFAEISVGQGPTGLALSADGGRLYVVNKFSASVSTIDTATNAELSRVPFFDPTPAAIRNGRPLLYDTHATSGLGHVSCASCHIDARSDFLAWDLGDPTGAVKLVNQPCRQGPGNCTPWHPMKGPMVTQVLQGIIGNEPMHWRGDRENLAAFAPAFTGLQGADAPPSSSELQDFADFISTVRHPPNPNRTLNGGLPAVLPVTGGNGNPAAGQNTYLTVPTLGPNTCVACHALPNGQNGQIDDPPLPLAPQSLKIVGLRGMHEKVGWNRGSLLNNKGFGFNHHSEFDTLFALLGAGFNFPGGVQQRRDVEAFMLAFTNDTHAAVGQQITFNGANNGDPGAINRFNTFVSLADADAVGLVAHGRVGGIDRGYVYVGGNTFQSDRAGETIAAATLRSGAAAGAEVSFTVVPAGTQVRIGVDRDADGHLDRDELERCGDPANASIGPALRADVNIDGQRNAADVPDFVSALLGLGSLSSQQRCAADVNADGRVDGDDIAPFTGCVLAGACPGP